MRPKSKFPCCYVKIIFRYTKRIRMNRFGNDVDQRDGESGLARFNRVK